MITTLFTKIKSVLLSKRFQAFYWSTGTMAVAGFLDIVLQELTEWDPQNLITVGAGLAFAQVTKAMNNWYQGK
jgi:predicted Kef-type K+ transport protein